MAKDFIKQWDGRRLEDWGSVVSKEFNQFQNAFKREVERLAQEGGAKLVSYSKGHYDMSGFIEKDGIYVYFSYGALDRTKVQLTSASDFISPLLMRTAKHEKDFSGGSNNHILFTQFLPTMQRLFKQQQPSVVTTQPEPVKEVKPSVVTPQKSLDRRIYDKLLELAQWEFEQNMELVGLPVTMTEATFTLYELTHDKHSKYGPFTFVEKDRWKKFHIEEDNFKCNFLSSEVFAIAYKFENLCNIKPKDKARFHYEKMKKPATPLVKQSLTTEAMWLHYANLFFLFFNFNQAEAQQAA